MNIRAHRTMDIVKHRHTEHPWVRMPCIAQNNHTSHSDKGPDLKTEKKKTVILQDFIWKTSVVVKQARCFCTLTIYCTKIFFNTQEYTLI